MSQSRKRVPVGPPLATRRGNKDAHPGLPDLAKPHKTATEVQAEKNAKSQALQAAAATKRAKVKRLDEIEKGLLAEASSSPPVTKKWVTSSTTKTSRGKRTQQAAESLEVSSSPPPVTKKRLVMMPSTTAETPRKKLRYTDEVFTGGDDSGIEDNSAKMVQDKNELDCSKDGEDEASGDGDKDNTADTRSKSRFSSGHSPASFMDVDGDKDEVEVASKKGPTPNARCHATGSTPSKSVLQKRSEPDTPHTRPTKSTKSNVPPLKRLRPIGGLNSHWTPSGKHAVQAARPPSSTPPPDPFDEGPDAGEFDNNSTRDSVHINTPTPRPRGHTKLARGSSGPDLGAHNSRNTNEVEGMGETMGGTAVTSKSTVPARLARPVVTNTRTRIPTTAIRQDTNPLTQVSHPVIATLGPKSRNAKSAPGTQRRSGRKPRWTTEHLDEAVRPTFNGPFMSKVRELAGTLPPFTTPSADAIQTLFDKMYPDLDVVVEKGKVVFDLTMQRLNEWKFMIGSEAVNNVKAYLEVEEADDPDEVEGLWCFASPTEYVEWAVHSEDGKNAPMYWARWNGGVGKEGRFQFHLVLKTLSAHLAVVPPRSGEHPSGALILSLLAVERALKFSWTGTPIIPRGPQGFFSAENWGDQTVRINEGQVKLNRKASKFFTAVDALSGDVWSKILDGAYKWLDQPVKREDEVIEESDDDDDFMMSSDPPIPESDDVDELEEDDAWYVTSVGSPLRWLQY
ncbi:hypothetical protein OF83DRAFT_1170573 [Amylostereum chailletii]|nr:hypothetical protein OF83DRAFT_1170573 [Amylostereum chailletii]